MRNSFIKALAILLFVPAVVFAQETKTKKYPIKFTGSVQSDILFPQKDSLIGAKEYDEFALTNTYVDLNLLSEYADIGTRFEFLKYPLPGYEADFAGWGLPFFYATGKYKTLRVTIGDFYEQFGSGLIFRTYQERSLGIDNALRGGRILWAPYKGISFKALGGKQRRYWDRNDSFIWGGDVELSIDQWVKKMSESGVYWMVGGSFISKYEKDEEVKLPGGQLRLNLPENVAAFNVRTRLQAGGYTFLADYAYKFNDPSADNNYIYKPGSVLLLSGSYTQRGLSVILQAKRSDNMSFRSMRGMTGTSSFINHLPAFSMQHSYTLAAMYPYATQPDGEWAFQGSAVYTFKRKTALGGKYGTTVKFNVSHVRAIEKKYELDEDMVIQNSMLLRGTDGYTSDFFKMGEAYYQDINVGIEKKFTSSFKLNAMYMNQIYNKFVVEKHIDEGEEKVVRSNIFILEGQYQFSPKVVLRGEAQYLATKQDKGDWIYGALELSLPPAWMISLSDTYNNSTNLHYYSALLTYTYKSHRFQGGYARTRKGYNCSGGVCREVPASKGFILSYNFNF